MREPSKYYDNGRQIRCHECVSQKFHMLVQGKSDKSNWYNLECENGHFQTIYTPNTLRTAAVPFYDDGQKIPIIRHEITITYTKYVTLYLPEDEDVKEHLPNYEDQFDYADAEEVFQEHHQTDDEYDAADLYDGKGNLREEWDPLQGELTGSKVEIPIEVSMRPDTRLDQFFALSPTPP
jgi:hypothetical protein